MRNLISLLIYHGWETLLLFWEISFISFFFRANMWNMKTGLKFILKSWLLPCQDVNITALLLIRLSKSCYLEQSRWPLLPFLIPENNLHALPSLFHDYSLFANAHSFPLIHFLRLQKTKNLFTWEMATKQALQYLFV